MFLDSEHSFANVCEQNKLINISLSFTQLVYYQALRTVLCDLFVNAMSFINII